MTIFRPDPHPEISSVDGYVLANATSGGEDWAVLRAGISDRFASNDNLAFASILIKSEDVEDKWDRLHRGIISFDTSEIEDDARIISATLSLHGGAGKRDELGITPSINLYAVSLTDDTDIVLDQPEMETMWDSFGSTAYCDTAITFASWNTSGWNTFTLNAIGLDAISKTGNTRIGLREVKYDVSGTPPAWSHVGTDDEAYIYWWTADWSEELAPKLTITFSTDVMRAGNFAVVETRLHWITTLGNEVYIQGVLIGASDQARGNVAVVEERTQYVGAYGNEYYWQGIEIGVSTIQAGNIAVVEDRLGYIDTSSKERYIKGIPV